MLRRFSINFAIVSMMVDALIAFGVIHLMNYLRPSLSFLPFAMNISQPGNLPLLVFIAFPVLWVAAFALFSIYDGRRYLRIVDEFSAITLASLIAGVLMAGLLYLSYRDISRVFFASYVLASYLSFLVWRMLVRLLYQIRRDSSSISRRVLIVGAGPVGREVQLNILSSPIKSLAFVGFLDDDEAKRMASPEILGSVDDLRTIIAERNVSDVIITLPQRAHQRIDLIVNSLIDIPVQIRIVPDYFALTMHHAEIEDFAGIPMLDIRAAALDEYQRMMKRIFDLVVTALVMLPALLIMAVAALLILIDDGFPILFRQQRVGENGRLFEIYKFRTMIKNAEQLRSTVEFADEQGNLIHKKKDDPRITRVGKLLRRISIDEFPQLFNVLLGNMSLVGPRPELPYLVEKYQNWQRKRFSVPQGLTGWWQIHGRSDKPMHLHTEDDLYYVQHYSLWLDIKILIRTAWIVLRGKGAY